MHTPGPWRCDQKDGFTEITAGNDEGNVGAVVYNTAGDFSDEETRDWYVQRAANARLISAAPELLEALQYVLSAHGGQLHDAFDLAHKAIAKATGEH